MLLELCQEWSWEHFPVEPVPASGHPTSWQPSGAPCELQQQGAAPKSWAGSCLPSQSWVTHQSHPLNVMQQGVKCITINYILSTQNGLVRQSNAKCQEDTPAPQSGEPGHRARVVSKAFQGFSTPRHPPETEHEGCPSSERFSKAMHRHLCIT